jgi:hypothetical protein
MRKWSGFQEFGFFGDERRAWGLRHIGGKPGTASKADGLQGFSRDFPPVLESLKYEEIFHSMRVEKLAHLTQTHSNSPGCGPSQRSEATRSTARSGRAQQFSAARLEVSCH